MVEFFQLWAFIIGTTIAEIYLLVSCVRARPDRLPSLCRKIISRLASAEKICCAYSVIQTISWVRRGERMQYSQFLKSAYTISEWWYRLKLKTIQFPLTYSSQPIMQTYIQTEKLISAKWRQPYPTSLFVSLFNQRIPSIITVAHLLSPSNLDPPLYHFMTFPWSHTLPNPNFPRSPHRHVCSSSRHFADHVHWV